MPVYGFGSNGSGQLGIDHQEDVSIPWRHLPPSGLVSNTATRIAAGGNHTLILYDSGQLTRTAPRYSNQYSQAYSTEILANEVKLCSATWEASIYCSGENRLFACGRGGKGELGLGDEAFEVTDPGLPLDMPFLKDDVSIIDIASGVQHSVAVLSTGDVIGWGNGRKGQLGEPSEVVWKPRHIDGIPFKVNRAVCGLEFTYLVGDLDSGQHVVLGADKWHVRTDAPKAIPGWKDIGASWGSVFVLLDSGNIISWGRNDHGQLAPLELPEVDSMAIGSEHVLVRINSKQVCAWGWGEHGNCGSKTDESGDVKGGNWYVVTLPPNEEAPVQGVGAGCATSWVWT